MLGYCGNSSPEASGSEESDDDKVLYLRDLWDLVWEAKERLEGLRSEVRVAEEEGTSGQDELLEEAQGKPGGNGSSRLQACANLECERVESRKGEFKKCGRCRAVTYCSPTCQQRHWKVEHKI
eukprot:1173484-Prorocentrum_minimum.AAC.1